jgi:hypothetical protein
VGENGGAMASSEGKYSPIYYYSTIAEKVSFVKGCSLVRVPEPGFNRGDYCIME